MTEVVAKQNQRWQIAVAHYSLPIEDSHALSTPATPWPLPAELEARESGAAQEIANLISATPQDHFPVPFSDRADVLMVGTSAAEWIAGGPAAQRFTNQDRPGGIEVTRRGKVSAGVTEDSQVPWAAWNASLTVPAAAQRITLPVQVRSVFLREQNQWRRVQEHISLAVAD